MKTHLLLDRRMLHPQGIVNACLCVAPLKKDTENNPLFSEEFFGTPAKRWEPRYDNGYPNVLYDPKDETYRCYYTLFLEDPDSASATLDMRRTRHYEPTPQRRVGLAYAESKDGIHWVKPCLGFVEFEGSRENNILFRYAHGTGVMLDEREVNPQKRYKLVTKMDFSDGNPSFMAVNFSADGVHWGEMIPWKEHNPPADSHNFPFYDVQREKYCMLTRCWRDGVRVVVLCESDDFLHWSAPREVLRGVGFENQVYAMPVFYRHGLYLGLGAVFHEGDRTTDDFDTVDCEMYYAVSPDVFDAVSPGQPFIPRGEGKYPNGEYDCGCIYASPPVEIDGKLCFYYMGGNGHHTDYRETSLARGFIEKDRFCYYSQRVANCESILTTSQLKAEGERLFVIAEIQDGGFIKASLKEKWNGTEFEGFTETDCRLEQEEDGRFRLCFAKPLTKLPKCEFFLALRFKNARIYAVAGDIEQSVHRLWEGI